MDYMYSFFEFIQLCTEFSAPSSIVVSMLCCHSHRWKMDILYTNENVAGQLECIYIFEGFSYAF